MEIDITNIPKDKFTTIQAQVLRVLVQNGLADVDTVTIEDLNDNFIGFEFDIHEQ